MKGVVWPLIVTMAIQALVSLVVYTPPVLAPVAQSEIGVPARAVGIVTALIYLAAMFTAFSAGNIINRFGAMRASQLSLLLCAAGMTSMASTNAWLVAFGALVIGTGYGVVTPSSSAILADRSPRHLRALVFSIKQMCMGTFLVVFLAQRIGLTLGAAGAALSAAMIAGSIGRILWGVVADNWMSSRAVLGWLGALMALSAFVTASMSPSWPYAAMLLVSFLYGACAFGWNGVLLAEVVHISPKGTAGSATGASLAITYAGVVFLPTMFWLIVHVSGSYAAAFAAAGGLTLWRGVLLLRPTA